MSTPNPLKRTKQRASRIALDYYKRGDKMLRWKRMLAAVAGLVAIGWLAAGFLRHDESRYSPGELAWAHASWEQDCAACHVNFSPIRGDALLAQAGGKSNAADQRCKVCHGDVVDHHPIQVLKEISCASCHTEHQGRGAVLTRMADRACTQCHADLDRHAKDAVHFKNTSHFDPDPQHHPEFKSIAADPGRLKFSHRRHLAKGLTFGPLDRSDACKLDEKFPPSFRQQYQEFVKENQLLKLDCSACHQLGAGAATALGASGPGTASPRSTGDYMQPVNYETHCQACHPLNFKPPSDTSCMPDSSEAIPHRLKPNQICQFVERAYSALVLKDDCSFLDMVDSRHRNLPSKPATQVELTRRLEFEQGINLASLHLHAVCSKCHQLAEANRWPQVDRVSVPELWLKHARFNHAAHKAAKLVCRDCHSNRSLDDSPPAWTKDLRPGQPIEDPATLDNSEVLIPGIRTCLECHGPSTTQGNRPRGGARTDCVECHWYHPAQETHGEQLVEPATLHGLGASNWNRVRRFDAARLVLPRRLGTKPDDRGH